jgi:hypothetical protein
VFEINNTSWKKPIADDLGTNTRDPQLKFKIQDWALEAWPGVPEWPPIIKSDKYGRIPRPEGSKAKGIQPDDRYDALGIMSWIKDEIEEGRITVDSPRVFKSSMQAS